MKLYKVLDGNGNSCNGGKYKWSLPTQNENGTWIPGEWTDPIEGELKPCIRGYHVCSADQLIEWLDVRIFEVEIEGEIIQEADKSVCRKCRLVKELTNWNERTARIFACDCAERVLPIFEKRYPEDNSPRIAIETSRKYANGKATDEELADAEASASASSYTAAFAAESAAGAYNTVTAADAARAARAAARADAAYVAEVAVAERAAARADAAYVAEVAVAEVAYVAEREWQIEHLKELLKV